MKKILRWLTIPRLLVAVLFIGIFTMAVRIPVDTDAWWHLRSGQYVVESQTFFSADPFSHTYEGQLWVYPKLAQVFWYGLFALGGWPGLSLGLALIVTVAFGLVWLITPGNLYIRAFATILGVITSSLIWIARPQMISFLLAALVLLLLEQYKRTASRWIYTLPLITILWANMHGGYAIAFILLLAYVVGEILNLLTGRTDPPVLTWRQIGILAGVGLVSYAVVVINPYGWQMWVYPFRTVGIGALREFIQEWRSPNFHMAITWPFVAMLLLTLIAMGRTSRDVDWTDLALVGGWTVLSFLAVRNIGLYGLLTVPVLARYSDDVVGSYLTVGREVSTKRPLVVVYFNWFLLSLIALVALLRISITILPLSSTVTEQDNLPRAAVQYIQENNPAGPMFNSYNWGGYLIFELWPEYPVYIDGRTDLYEDDFMRRYVQVMSADDKWSQILNEDGINLVLIERYSALAKFLRRDRAWQVIYDDDIAVIFARKTDGK